MSLSLTVEAVQTMLALARITGKPGLRAAAYRDAGVHLARLRHGRAKAEWADLVTVNCGLSVSRAYELMAVAAGTKTLADTRADTASRRRAHYARQSKGLAPDSDSEAPLSRGKKSNKINCNGRN